MTEKLMHTQRERQRHKLVEGVTTAGDSTTDNSTECVSQQELAAVRKRVDQLHSQIHYWQSINIRNIVQDHCSSQNTGKLGIYSECTGRVDDWCCQAKLAVV